jgi:hypothetical protein
VAERKTRFDKQKINGKLFQILSPTQIDTDKIIERFYQISDESEYDDTIYKKYHSFFKTEFKQDISNFIESLLSEFKYVIVAAYLSYLPNSVTKLELEDTLSVLSKNIDDVSKSLVTLNSTISEIVFSLAENETNLATFLETRTNPKQTPYSRKYSAYIRESEAEFIKYTIGADFQKNIYTSLQYLKYTIDNILKSKQQLIKPNLLEKISKDKNKDYFNKISDHLIQHIHAYPYFKNMELAKFCESSLVKDLHTKLVIVFVEVYFYEHIKKMTYRSTREKYTNKSFKKYQKFNS